MRIWIIPHALSGLSGAIVGFAAAALLFGGGRSAVPTSSAPMALRPSSEDDGREMHPAPGVGSRPGVKGSGAGEAGGDTGAGIEEGARAAELRELRAREHELRAREKAAREALSVARERMAQLKKEVEKEQPLRSRRASAEFDLTPEDWRQLAAQGVMKYRLPCEGQPPSDGVLDKLGLAPDDRDVVRQAYESSGTRLRSALLPLCAAALGGRLEVAQEMSTGSCRQVIESTTEERSESQLKSAQSVASFMAGDAPRPGDDGTLTERMFLVLAEESRHFEDELAEAFGPEEAHRLAFADSLCFYKATHHFLHPP